jgi:deoxyribonuclease V
MYLAFDTYYFGNRAKTVCLSFTYWTQTINFGVYSEVLENVEAYIPGAFYRRELPCILSLLQKVPAAPIEAIIVDGFVYLDDAGTFGLGGHLYQRLEEKIPVIGVAKTDFATIKQNKRALLRGQSNRPLFITAVGMDPDTASDHIRSMSGTFRIPDLLKHLDHLTRQLSAG